MPISIASARLAPVLAPSLLVPSLLAGLTIIAAPLEGPIVFQPADGSKVERTYTWTESMETTSVSLLQDGEDATDAPRAMSSVERTRSLGVVDEFVRSAPNRPLEFIRRYDDTTEESSGELELESQMGDVELPLSGEGTSELEGVGVRFTWDAEAEEWIKGYADDYEGSEALLEPLTMTHEFIDLLPDPDKDAAVGDQWDVEPSALLRILRPGGVLPLDFETDLDAIEGVLDPLRLPGVFDALDGEVSGEITARVESIEDGLAKIICDFDVEAVTDQGDVVDALLGDALPDGVDGDILGAEYTTSIEGKGTLVWDLEAKRAVSFRFAAEAEMELEVQVEVDAEGQVLEFTLQEKRSGKVGLTLE